MVKELRDTIAGLPEADQVRILWQNAVDLYRLPPT
jgi:predicted TIM-barrel fold metal-dependent hydrolase